MARRPHRLPRLRPRGPADDCGDAASDSSSRARRAKDGFRQRSWTPMPVDGPLLEVGNSALQLGRCLRHRAGQVLKALTRHRDPGLADQDESQAADNLHGQGLQELLRALDDEEVIINTSALMTGYARVIGVLPSTQDNARFAATAVLCPFCRPTARASDSSAEVRTDTRGAPLSVGWVGRCRSDAAAPAAHPLIGSERSTQFITAVPDSLPSLRGTRCSANLYASRDVAGVAVAGLRLQSLQARDSL